MAYTKHNWTTGETITATNLNHAETGIFNATITTTTVTSGVISFKDGGGNTAFTVTLPLYNGGVE